VLLTPGDSPSLIQGNLVDLDSVEPRGAADERAAG
jgi:hypothetical protein